MVNENNLYALYKSIHQICVMKYLPSAHEPFNEIYPQIALICEKLLDFFYKKRNSEASMLKLTSKDDILQKKISACIQERYFNWYENFEDNYLCLHQLIFDIYSKEANPYEKFQKVSQKLLSDKNYSAQNIAGFMRDLHLFLQGEVTAKDVKDKLRRLLAFYKLEGL